MKKSLRIVSKASVIGVCLAGVVGFSRGSYAGEDAVAVGKYELIIFEDTRGASEMLDGELTTAIDKIRLGNSLDSRYARHTNLCAAYTAQREFGTAEGHCRTAMNQSNSRRNSIETTNLGYSNARVRKAIALNNLGVLHALQGNSQEAREYFQAASTRSKHVTATSDRNISALAKREGSAVVVAS